MSEVLIHFKQPNGYSRCGQPLNYLSSPRTHSESWSDISCKDCLGRSAEAKVIAAFKPAIDLIDLMIHEGYATHAEDGLQVANLKHSIVEVRNLLLTSARNRRGISEYGIIGVNEDGTVIA